MISANVNAMISPFSVSVTTFSGAWLLLPSLVDVGQSDLEVIIFACVQCKCGYGTLASRTHAFEEIGKNTFKFTAPFIEKKAG